MDVALKAAMPDRMLANKGELAKLLRVSLPTLNSLIDRYPDFPIETRGSNGIEWEFDAPRVIEFIREKKTAEANAAAERRDLFAQFELPELEPEADGGPLSASQRLAMAKALQLERKMAREEGLLMPVSELRPALTSAIVRLGKSLETLPGQLARQLNLPDEVARAMRRSIDDFRRNAVRDLQEFLVRDVAIDG